MARPRTKSKRMSIGIDADLMCWMELMGRELTTGQSGYLMGLVRRDRDERMKDAETERRYRMYLEAVGAVDELTALDDHERDSN